MEELVSFFLPAVDKSQVMPITVSGFCPDFLEPGTTSPPDPRSQSPLHGVRMVEIGAFMAAPFATIFRDAARGAAMLALLWGRGRWGT
ncbi:hypothetical protein [Saccharopolyspora spinosa]|uniref:Uncharacterized protein n=1 Tax=Saccharopolyspora spinosa TaxID=60894 RepID=A0A2N3Y2U3_SACSN|nr:hypothetical protein [Saccharopolyspora spinosa]PKW17253.1 hypothetical protein A8926_5191 [Saccharopolyspora spinosa]